MLAKYGWDGNRLREDDYYVNYSFSSSTKKHPYVHNFQSTSIIVESGRKMENTLCLVLPFHGRDGNRMISLANALRLAKHNHSYVALNVPWSKWYRSWFDQRDDVFLDYEDKCGEIISSNSAYYAYSYQEHNPILRELIPSKKIRDTAESTFSTPFISVHRRQHETCNNIHNSFRCI